MGGRTGGPNLDDDDEATHADAATATTTASSEQRSNHDWWSPSWGAWNSWSWNAGWSGSYGAWGGHSYGSSSTSSYDSERREQELLATFIQGWYLLTDASLDSHERNLVVTALGGNFSPAKVAQELRNQFPETEVKRRDHSRRYQSYLGEIRELDEDEADEPETDFPDNLEEIFNEEGFAMMSSAETEAQAAMAAIETARRTLKDARQRQHLVKQNRKYYQNAGHRATSTTNHKPKDDSNLDCLRCGKRGHRAANCPHKPIGDAPPAAQAHLAQGSSSSEPQQAPFVCYADSAQDIIFHDGDHRSIDNFVGYAVQESFHAGPSTEVENALTTSEAVAAGMAVIDGGATQTIGSVRALEAVLQKNRQRYGTSGLKGLATEEPPSFAFGNSTENRCLSTAQIRVQANGQPGELRVHTLESGEAPILLSIQTLRSLKAIIDFEADVAVFRALDPHRLVHLTRGSSGRQLLSLTEDWMSISTPTKQAIPSLLSHAAC